MVRIDSTSGQRLKDALAWAEAHPYAVGLAELLRATSMCRISLAIVLDRRESWTPKDVKSELPTVVLIGDDHGDSRDPDEWRCSMSVIAWARSAVVHGTGATAWHYAQAVRLAEKTGRCLFIETDSVHAPAWAAAILPRRIPGLMLIPTDGGVHPVAEVGS